MSILYDMFDSQPNITMLPRNYSSPLAFITQALSYQEAIAERPVTRALGVCANDMCKNGFRCSSARLDFVKLENKIFYKKFSTYIRNRIDCPSCEHALLWSTNYSLAPTDHDVKRMIRMNIKWGA